MTLRKSLNCQPSTFEQATGFQGVQSILRTGGIETTSRWKKWGDKSSVKVNDIYNQFFQSKSTPIHSLAKLQNLFLKSAPGGTTRAILTVLADILNRTRVVERQRLYHTQA